MLRSKFRLEKSKEASSNHNPDFMLDNFVEAEVKSVLWPLYVVQWLSLAPKYSIRYGLITSNSYKFNVIVFLCAVGIGITWFSSVLGYLTRADGIYAVTLFAYSVTLVFAIILNSFITTSHSNMNAHLIVLIQRIQKRFMFVKFDNRGIAIINWVFLMVIIAYNIAHFTTRLLESRVLITIVFTHFIYLSIDCNSIVAIRMIHLLGKLIDTWISELKYFSRTNCNDTEPKDYFNKLILAYDELMEALKISDKIFRLPIFFTVLASFFHVFVNVQAALSVSYSNIEISNLLIYLPVWTKSMYVAQLIWVKNLTIVAILCMESEIIQLKVRNAQVACIVLSARETATEMSKLMRRQEPWARSKRGAGWLRAAGLFPVDAALPPRFLDVLATYVIVILQYHFL
nr:gustatory receptor 43 [Papilio xuthus]